MKDDKGSLVVLMQFIRKSTKEGRFGVQSGTGTSGPTGEGSGTFHLACWSWCVGLPSHAKTPDCCPYLPFASSRVLPREAMFRRNGARETRWVSNRDALSGAEREHRRVRLAPGRRHGAGSAPGHPCPGKPYAIRPVPGPGDWCVKRDHAGFSPAFK